MSPNRKPAADGSPRFVWCGLALLAVLLASATIRLPVSNWREGTTQGFIDQGPAGDGPPAGRPFLPEYAESEIAAEGEIELEDGTEYSWPLLGHDGPSTSDRLIFQSQPDRDDLHRLFVDAADLSRSCRLTL